MDHVIEGPAGLAFSSESSDDVARVTATVRLEPGEKLRIVKFIAYAWSSQRSLPALRAQAAAALAEAKATGWDEICAEQRAYLDSFWAGADVVVEGDAELQQTLRFALFQLLQASGRAELRAIPSKGLTGPGYDGHTFWDSESFVLQALTYTAPDAARDALRWRHATIDLARERATTLGLQGAAFPWRTIRGQECSGYWPAGTAAFHIGADIADAALRYAAVTGDEEFAARGRPRAARRDGASLAFARTPRQHGRLPHRRRDRPGRVQRDRRQQRLHQPDGRAEPARGGRRGRPATAIGAPSSESGWRRRRRGATRRRPC